MISLLFSIIFVAFCVSLYFPYWYFKIYKISNKLKYERARKRNVKSYKNKYRFRRELFNSALILVTFLTPAVIFITLPIPTSNKNLLSKITNFSPTSQLITKYLLTLLITYIVLFSVIKIAQKNLVNKDYFRIYVIDKSAADFCNKLLTLIGTFAILIYPETDEEIIKSFSFLLFCSLSSDLCYSIFDYGLDRYSTKYPQNHTKRGIMKYHD